MRGLVTALALLLASCSGGELTEIIVVVDSNLPVPSELDAVQVVVAGTMRMTASGSLADLPLPRTVGLVHSGGALGPIEVRAIGSRGGVTVVEAVASTSFLRGRTLVLSMFLGRDCRGIMCADELTCERGMCVSNVVNPRTLPQWTGSVPRVDGGPECVPMTETCNGLDDDCDGRADEDFDLRTDSNNCGRCGVSCAAVPNASATCSGSVCVIDSCDANFDDCNRNPADGCEASLMHPSNCGLCGMTCSFANATATCPAGTCELDTCTVGFNDCNTDPADGCEETLRSLTHCGACGMACAVADGTAACATGSCEIEACDAGFGDCNTDPSDGCEESLDTLSDCGMCGMACAVADGTPTCATGRCEVATCDAGFGDCNTDPSDGCETTLDSLTNCGACGTACTISNGTGDCSTGSCEVAACDAGRGDCNMDPSDGCETNTRTDALHCGMCMNACPVGQMCRSSVCR